MNVPIPVNARPMFWQTESLPLVDLRGRPELAGNMAVQVQRVFMGTSHNGGSWLSGKSLEDFTNLSKAVSGTPRVEPGYGLTLTAGLHSTGQGTASTGSVEKRPRRTAEDVRAGGDPKVGADRRDELDDRVQRRLLRVMAAWAAAKKEVRAGEDWKEVAERHDITDPNLRSRLERMAAWRAAKKEIRAGEDWKIVAERHGITHSRRRSTLERVAAMSVAKKEVRAGESWKVVAKRHGITDPDRCATLERMALLRDVAEEPSTSRSAPSAVSPNGVRHLPMPSGAFRRTKRPVVLRDVAEEPRTSRSERSAVLRGGVEESQTSQSERSANPHRKPQLRLRYGK
jgi:hypothetical protein